MNYLSSTTFKRIILITAIAGLVACGGGGGGGGEGGGGSGGGNNGGGDDLPPRTTKTEQLLYRAVWNGEEYRNRSIGIPIVGATSETDWTRWATEEFLKFGGGENDNLYAFIKGTGNKIQLFSYERNSDRYEYKRDYTITGAPNDAKFGKFGASRGTQLYLQSQSDAATFYFFTFNTAEQRYEYDNSTVKLANIPADADLDRWGVTTDALGYVYLYTFKKGSNNTVYQFNTDFSNPRTLSFTDTQTLSGVPATADFSDFGTSGIVFTLNFLETKTTEIICGREGERACNIFERIPSCDPGLVEDFISGLCIKS